MAIVPLLIAGMPGRMAAEIARLALEDQWSPRVAPLPFGLTGEEIDLAVFDLDRNHAVQLTKPSRRDSLDIPANAIAIDFTEPAAALPNVRWYAEKGIPFVLGTTGYDRAEAECLVAGSGISAVIAPNMAIPIVLLQTALGDLAERFPGAMAGYGFSVKESHQKGKKDTSGTAKALVADFAKLGLPASVDGIEMVRDPQAQEHDLCVPPEHLAGHAYHFYDIESEGGDVRLGLSHCVNGRRVYADGALHAADFLARRMAEGSKGRVFTMTDVLEDMQADAS
jgi:4-hydroxy-tetrahydrodipicolinate reductase